MNPIIQKLLTSSPEQRKAILSGLKPEELAVVFVELEEIERTPPRRWYCPKPECNGNPHAGYHWCEHPIDGHHTPYCKHSRTPQRPPISDPNDPWLVWFFSGGRGTGKALSLNTLIPTPFGWVKMGEIKVGDVVFDEQGRMCNVTATFDVTPNTAYKLMFSDGSEIIACDEHQWVTLEARERKQLNRKGFQIPEQWAAKPPITTSALVETLTYGKRKDRNHAIPLALPLQTPTDDLPIDPYVLGVWLGDGSSASAEITCHDDDAPHYGQMFAFAGEAWRLARRRHNDKPVGTYCIGERDSIRSEITGRMEANGSVHSRLRLAGLLNNKHIPTVYLRADITQRLALLQGLMDTDGGVDKRTGTVEFTSTKRHLAEGVLELARSLGQKPTLAVGRATLYGKDCGPKFRVTWRPTVAVFSLPRKASFVRPIGKQQMRNACRMVVSADIVDTEPMRCLTVDSPNSMYLAGEAMIPTHNTRAGAEWVLDLVWNQGFKRIALVGRTPADVRDVMIYGDALAVDTPVPTPSGWTTMGELQEGDVIIGGDGQPCRVTHAFPIMQDRPCYEVTLANGATVIADEKHKWLTENAHERRMRYTGSVRTTKELAETLYVQTNHPKARRANHAIRLPKFSEFGELPYLPIDPYVLGAWLGDGTSKWGAVTSMDSEIIERIENAGYQCRVQKGSGQGQAHTYGILKLGAQLRDLGILNNKHIPIEYLRASYSDRLALLQGLMDTDGFVSVNGQCEFVQKDERLAYEVLELVSSLGIKARITTKVHHGVVGNGNTHHRITFTTTQPVFHLSRKSQRLPQSFRDEGLLHIRSVEATTSVSVRCISVDSPDRTYMVGHQFVPTHNSGIMSVSDPNPRPQHEPTKRRLVWPNGAQAFTYSAAAPSQLRGPQHDAAWCVAAGELVSTKRGEIPIEKVLVGDYVMTRSGWKCVLAATQTNPNAEVLELHTNAGQVLRCTPNHKVFANGEWVEAQDVVPSDVLVGKQGDFTVSAVLRKGQTAAVYDLTVEGTHEFFASEILVHNCDELAAWTDAPKGDTLDTSWNNLMLGLRLGQVPRCLVTTTPKRVKLVRQVMERRTTVVTNGSTYENLDNLAPAFREQVLSSYEGTRIGEQELKGVLLMDVEGAMWTLEMIDQARAEILESEAA